MPHCALRLNCPDCGQGFLLPSARHREELAYGCMVLQLEGLRNGLIGSLVSRYWLLCKR
jgi:hypothetical protein